jgi:hypothetical protein
MPFAITPNVHVERAPDGSVRQLRHLQQPYAATARSPRFLAAAYLQDVAGVYAIPPSALSAINTAYQPGNQFTHDPSQLRFAGQSAQFDTTTVTYVQTLGTLPIWEAGFSATVQQGPQRITSSFATLHHDAKVEPPERDFRPYSVEELARFLGLRDARKLEITAQRRLIYRYQDEQRIDPESRGRPAPLHGPKPTLSLPEVPDAIQEGHHYIVVEVLFVTEPGPHSMNWRAFIEERTDAVIYLRALVSCVFANVYAVDPVSDTGNASLTGCSGDASLDPVQITVDLSVTAASPQPLTGQFVTLSDFRSPTSAVPTSPPTNFTNLASDSLDFGATNAYYHMDRFFRLMSDLGFDPATYFSATGLPLPVDPLDTTNGDPQAWTYANAGNAGCRGIGFAHTASGCGNPVLMGADQRVAFHECSHMILLERIHAANFGFCHSTGDSLAVIYADPRSSSPDRFLTFPFVPLIGRRHDRDVTAVWAWGGTNDDHGYGSEQILATTQFRLYLSSGGDDGRVDVRLQTSNYILYLIIRAVGSLGPGTIVPTPSADVWATALMNADTGTTSFQGIPGGTLHKMIRWAFEKQGLYQPPGAPVPVATAGAPPDVDVYIDDGRGGEYPYLPAFWNNTDIWNRSAPDGGTTHQTPVVGVANYAYARVKNRGTQAANNVSVAGYHATPASGLNWPDDWMAMTTASLPAGSIPSGGSTIVGPFTWTPQYVGHECMLMIASADGDLPNTDPATGLPCASGPTPHWHLVPFDNNIGQRNVAPVAGGGGGLGLVASFDPRSFTARNPFEQTARIVLEGILPSFLARRGWTLRFTGAGGNTFSLPGRGERSVTFVLVPGQEFLPGDVPSGADGRIEVHARVEGRLIGGMSYQVDPGLKKPPRELPSGEDDCHGRHTVEHHRKGRTRLIIDIDVDDDDK